MPTNVIVAVQSEDRETQIAFRREIRRAQELGFDVVPIELRGHFIDDAYRRERATKKIFNPTIFNELRDLIRQAPLLTFTQPPSGRLQHDRISIFMHGGTGSGFLGSRQLALLAAASISARPEIFDRAVNRRIIVQIVLVSCYGSGGTWGQERISEIFPTIWNWVLTQTSQNRKEVIGRVKGYQNVVTTLRGGHRGRSATIDESEDGGGLDYQTGLIQRAQQDRGYSFFDTSLSGGIAETWSDSDVEHAPWTGRTANRTAAAPAPPPAPARRAHSAPYAPPPGSPLANSPSRRRALTPFSHQIQRTQAPLPDEDAEPILGPPIDLDHLFQFDASPESRLLQCMYWAATGRSWFCEYSHAGGYYQLTITIEDQFADEIQVPIRIQEGAMTPQPTTTWLNSIFHGTPFDFGFVMEVINAALARRLIHPA